ncbi:hypothetical protein VTN49DRAFT_1026 [Thermomyces lanuginosus]|uniref:uncharacterized protein n=1 Tax=Thermomyces lanuginosus TaxID=5541 RepID=UPI003742F8B4
MHLRAKFSHTFLNPSQIESVILPCSVRFLHFFTSSFSSPPHLVYSSHFLPSFPPSHLLLSFSWQELLSQGFSLHVRSSTVLDPAVSVSFLHTPVF